VWFWQELNRLLPEVRGYPEPIQEAHLDLPHNLGPAGRMKSESLIAAARKATGKRRQVTDERNREIAGLIRNSWFRRSRLPASCSRSTRFSSAIHRVSLMLAQPAGDRNQ
jgi:hypothetical protein